MTRASRLFLSSLLLALVATAPGARAQDAPSPLASLFKRLEAAGDSFARYRVLASPELQADPRLRQVAAQLVASELDALGRHGEALQAFPMRRPDPADAGLPTPASHRAVDAIDWIRGQAADYRVVMVNEAHHAAHTRLLSLALLEPLRALGYTHLAVEALANEGADPMPAGYPVRATGHYTQEPVFAELLRSARRLGYVLLPYEAGPGAETQQARETAQARVIAGLLQRDPRARVLVHAGYAHIGEQKNGMPEDARPMAMELAAMTGLPLLTLDQASPRAWEAGDIATPGNTLAARFAVAGPSVLLDRDGDTAWSRQPGVTDAAILLPSTPARALRPDWLRLAGLRQPVAVDLAACLDHLPCLAQARHAGEGDDAIPADQFLMLASDEAGTPLYLAPGRYRLRLVGHDGTALAERTLDVPAHHGNQTP